MKTYRVGILGFGDHAVSIPEVEIAAVKLIVSFPKLAQPCAYVATGDRVRVRSGPLRGLEGYVCYLKSITRIIVSVPHGSFVGKRRHWTVPVTA